MAPTTHEGDTSSKTPTQPAQRETPQAKMTLKGHQRWVRGVAFIPNTRLLVTCSHDKSLRVWDMHTGQQVGEPLSGHDSEVRTVAASPDGRWIVSGASNGSILAWEVATNQSVRAFESHEKMVHGVVFAPDSKTFASASWDETVCVWKRETGETILGPFEVESPANSVSYSSDGNKLAAGTDTHIIVWSIVNGKELLKIQRRAWGVAFTPDGLRLVSGNMNDIQISDATTGDIIKRFDAHTKPFLSLAIAPNGTKFATTSFDQTTRFFDLTTFEPIGEPLEHPDWVSSVAFSKDSKLIATGCGDTVVRTWTVPQSESEKSAYKLLQDNIPRFNSGLQDSEVPDGFFDDYDTRSPAQHNTRTASHNHVTGSRIKNIMNRILFKLGSSTPQDHTPRRRSTPTVDISATRGKYRTANAISGKRHLVQRPRPPRQQGHASGPATLQSISTAAHTVTSGAPTLLGTERVAEVGCLAGLARCFSCLSRSRRTGPDVSRSR